MKIKLCYLQQPLEGFTVIVPLNSILCHNVFKAWVDIKSPSWDGDNSWCTWQIGIKKGKTVDCIMYANRKF